MTNRATLKPDHETKDRLDDLKRGSETWDDLLTRLAEYGELVEKGPD
jgi:hypothetical protein